MTPRGRPGEARLRRCARRRLRAPMRTGVLQQRAEGPIAPSYENTHWLAKRCSADGRASVPRRRVPASDRDAAHTANRHGASGLSVFSLRHKD
jgi:hypothetical protein